MKKLLTIVVILTPVLVLWGCNLQKNSAIETNTWNIIEEVEINTDSLVKKVFTGDDSIANQLDVESLSALCPAVMFEECTEVYWYYDKNNLKQGLRTSYAKWFWYWLHLTEEQREKLKNEKGTKYAEAYFKDDKLEWSYKQRGGKGTLRVEWMYKNGKREWIWRSWDIDNNDLVEEGEFKNGEKVGIWKMREWEKWNKKIKEIDCDDSKAVNTNWNYFKNHECYIFKGLGLGI